MKKVVWWRVGLLALALLLAGAAAYMYASDNRAANALVLARDVPAGQQLVEADLEYRTAVGGALPTGAVSDPAEAVGKHARGPLPKGQYLVAGQLDPVAGRALAESSFPLPDDWALVSLPIEFEHALGGAVAPGQAVDLYAVVKRSAGPAEILVPGARLVDLRSRDGGSLALARSTDAGGDESIGSVLIAVPRALLGAVIARIESSHFVLATAVEGGP